MARYQATGIPQLTCVYDELTESTQLLGVLCAALEALADGEGPSSLLPAPFHELGLRHDAVRLRRLFGGVTALPYDEALNVGRTLRLNRLDHAWASALRLALVLLGGLELQAGRSNFHDFRAVELSAETDKIWEWIVNAALARTDFDAVLSQGRQQLGLNSDPWIAHPLVVQPNTNPDNIAFRDKSIFVVDAKYKTPKGAPGRDDQYQMFAYSHLVRAEGRNVRAAVLVYPGDLDANVWVRGRDTVSDPVQLFAVQLPFPQPEDLISLGTWSAYLDRIGQRMGEELGLIGTALIRPESA